MRVLVIAPSLRNTSPGSRFRIEQWMPYLESEGVEFTYAPFEDEELHQIIYTQGNRLEKAHRILRAFARRFGLLPGLRRYDVAFIYEEAARLGPAIVERLIARLGVPIVYDFCDPIYLPYKSPSNQHLSYLKFFGKTAAICRLARQVIVGNEDLAAYARRYNSAVTVIPITIDTTAYQPRPSAMPHEGEVPVIGWSGSHSTVRLLDERRDMLRDLRKKRVFRLGVIGTPRYHVDGVEVDARPWRLESEVEDLYTFDIGIMPLPDDPWVRLRTHLKSRQYMGLGIPCVASPVGVNRELIRDGVDGMLAARDEEWTRKLALLIDDAALRRRLGAAGRKTIEERYSAAQWAPRVLQILRIAAGESRTTARTVEASRLA